MILHIIALAAIIATAVLAIEFKDLLISTAMLAAMSLMLSLEFYLLQAPDVAITEAAVGACLSTAIFIIAIKKTARYENGAC
ncbi:MAG: DUF4040 domain-containing protein [Candidatus Diapherotrites archaeon]|nr:DUF4040 domain-containing protein [Candidatus Diapherotrites archaeon]